jgi:hypothetical protein
MDEPTSAGAVKVRWPTVAVLVLVCAAVLGASLYVAHRHTSSTPAKGPYPDLVLVGRLTKDLPWRDLSVNVTWDGTKAGAIPSDLQAVYRGETLYKVIGLVDDNDPSSFNVALAEKGYQIRFIAEDGYEWTMSSKAIVGQTGWIIARLKNGRPLPKGEGPYRDVGSFIHHFYGAPSVKMIKRIELLY